MKLCTLMTAMVLASPAFAHIEKGTHQGTTETGAICSMIAGADSFVNNQPHPLNERIEVQVDGDVYTVGHPAVIDTEKGIASFNHDLFHGVLATTTGAKALVIEMVHTATKEGPAGFTLINHNWKTNTATKVVCSNLQFVK